MADKVLAIIRETMLHENILESMEFRPGTGEVVLRITQINDRSAWPDYELTLTFSEVRTFTVTRSGSFDRLGDEILSFECRAESGYYEAMIGVGVGFAEWSVQMTFNGLRYQRRPDSPAT
ncbi:hypothetical protein [Singulisphaera sp. PoT]|uniref:hypothetical protein n=1 Tax=Singulisphaera sp. PoT TaxID=3411797 RepID=UPI003BF5EE72